MEPKAQNRWRIRAVAALAICIGVGLCLPKPPKATAEIIPRVSLPGMGAFLFQPPPPVQEPLRIYHIDVGQGDATLIVGPGSEAEHKVLVVDGGDPVQSPNFDGGLRFLQALRKLGIRSLDHVFVSHYDYDHIGGFVGGDRGREASILLGEDGAAGLRGVDDDSDGQVDWTNAAKTVPDREEMGSGDDLYTSATSFYDRGDVPPPTSGTAKRYLSYVNSATRVRISDFSRMGEEIQLGGGATATVVCGNGFVLNHTGRLPKVTTENERSAGLLINFGKFDYLICGDLIGQKFGAEDAELEAPLGAALKARGHSVEVLHVNHHGAANATNPGFISELKPTVGIISVGTGNNHDHPKRETLDTLFNSGVRVFQTEAGIRSKGSGSRRSRVMQGHILVEAQPTQFRVKSWGSLGPGRVNNGFSVRTR